MNSLIKYGVAGALALGASAAAQASIVQPGSYGPTGDVVLFAEVVSGSTVLGSYIGDTGISVDSIGAALPTGSQVGSTANPFTDSNLNTLLSEATSGTSVYWALQGGWGNSDGSGSLYEVSSGTKVNLSPSNGLTLYNSGNGLYREIVNTSGIVGSGTSVLSTNAGNSATGGTGYDYLATVPNASDWYGATGDISSVGLGSTTAFWLLTASAPANSANTLFTQLGTATLTADGLSFSPVPLPAAVWLLGSGLLGLAGVARRRAGAA